MKLQTQIEFTKVRDNLIDYNSQILLLGSCFSENIGNKFTYFKFKTTQNPFGILFQPKAIENLIAKALHKKEYSEKDLFFLNERWHSFEAHSQLSSVSKEEILNSLNIGIQQSFDALHKSSHIIITLGTAWVYRLISKDSWVANCHKIPQREFIKELLTVDQIKESLRTSISLIKSVNPSASILFTVSPVRHLKDGFTQNMQSKAHLLTAVHEVVNTKDQIHYFPSYEIMMDELRDYRFYKEDLVHPSQMAINYIWEKVINNFMDNSTLLIMKKVEAIQKGINHKPFNSNSSEHEEFLKKLNKKVEKLQKSFPHIKF